MSSLVPPCMSMTAWRMASAVIGSARQPFWRSARVMRRVAACSRSDDSGFLVAPRAKLCSDRLEMRLRAGGNPDHEVEAIVLWCANPLTVDGQKGPADCPGKSFVSIHQCMVARQGVQQRS